MPPLILLVFMKKLLSSDTFEKNRHFSQAYIPFNERSKLKNPNFTISESGIPCCPHDSSLPMKPEGTAKILVPNLPA